MTTVHRALILHLILGPWASGKSTLVEHLARLLPQHVVFDWDLIIPALSATASKDVFTDPSTWALPH
jgi:ABC-type cobalamin/Fe3+-siderophores transport system ATPase subunit